MTNRIMIIEDDPMLQTELKNLLIGNGYEVFAVSNFTDAVTDVKRYCPHLIILDIRLPGASGYTVLYPDEYPPD